MVLAAATTSSVSSSGRWIIIAHSRDDPIPFTKSAWSSAHESPPSDITATSSGCSDGVALNLTVRATA